MPGWSMTPLVPVAPDAPRSERIEAAGLSYRKNPAQMTSVLARQYGLTELEVIQAMPTEQAVVLAAERWEEVIRGFESLGSVHVIVSNASSVIEVRGVFGGFSRTGPFFNVQSGSIDMHLRPDTFSHIFAVEKPAHLDGVPTLSVQFFDHHGSAAFKVFLTFGTTPPTPERREQWESICNQFGKP